MNNNWIIIQFQLVIYSIIYMQIPVFCRNVKYNRGGSIQEESRIARSS